MVRKIRLHLKSWKRLIVFYLRGCKIVPSKILHLQQSFYHQIKGLFDKKIFPYLYKTEKGETIHENSLVGSLIELHQKFENRLDDILQSLPPSRRVLTMLLTENKLSEYTIRRDFEGIKQTLAQLKEQASEVFVEECGRYSFDLAILLRDLMDEIQSDYKEVTRSSNIEVIPRIARNKRRVFIHFNEAAAWRNILRNLIINAIDACEGKTADNLVTIEYKATSEVKDVARITITDTGCGMDPDVLANFYKRGFTKGKDTGTGLGVVDEHLEFINQRGKFQINSVYGKGTTIKIEIDPRKIQQIDAAGFLYEKRKKLTRITALFLLLIVFFFAMGGGKWIFPPVTESDNYIAGFSPGAAFGENRPNEFQSIRLRTDSGRQREIKFAPSTIKITPLDSVGPICLDIDSDGVDEIVAAIVPPLDQRLKIAGFVECISVRGRLKWRFPMECEDTASILLPGSLDGEAVLRQLMIVDLNEDNSLDVLALANFPSGLSILVVLNCNGEEMQRYIHYGPISVYDFARESPRGPRLTVITGNNKLLDDKPILAEILFKPGIFQGVPYPDSSLAKAEETYYILKKPAEAGVVDLSSDNLVRVQ